MIRLSTILVAKSAVAKLLLAASLLLSASCSGPFEKEYEVRVIGTDENPIRCMVVIDGDWDGAGMELTPDLLTDRKIILNFDDTDRHRVQVRAVELDDQAEIVGGTRRDDRSSHEDRWRDIRPTDPPIILFVLEEKS